MIHFLIQTIKEHLPLHVTDPLLGLHLWQYVAFVVLTIAALCGTGIILFFLGRTMFLSGGELTIFLRFKRRLYALSLFGAITYAKPMLELPYTILWQNIIIGINAIFVVLSLLMVSKSIDLIFALLNRKMQQSQWDELGILQIFKGLAKIGAMTLTFLLVSRLFLNYGLGVWLKSISIGAGTITAIVALASKDLISNFFGALVITVGKPFKIGDRIVVNKLEGRVVGVDMRATKIVADTGNSVYVPNSAFITSHVSNYGKGMYIPIMLKLLLKDVKETAMDAFLESLEDMIKRYPRLQKDKSTIEVGKVAFSQGSLTLHLYFGFMRAAEKFKQCHLFMEEIQRMAKKSGIRLEQ